MLIRPCNISDFGPMLNEEGIFQGPDSSQRSVNVGRRFTLLIFGGNWEWPVSIDPSSGEKSSRMMKQGI